MKKKKEGKEGRKVTDYSKYCSSLPKYPKRLHSPRVSTV